MGGGAGGAVGAADWRRIPDGPVPAPPRPAQPHLGSPARAPPRPTPTPGRSDIMGTMGPYVIRMMAPLPTPINKRSRINVLGDKMIYFRSTHTLTHAGSSRKERRIETSFRIITESGVVVVSK